MEAESIWSQVKDLDYKEMKAKAIIKTRKREGTHEDRQETNIKKLEAAKSVLRNKGQQPQQDRDFNEMEKDEQDRIMLNR